MGDVTPCRKCGLPLSEPTSKVYLDGAVWACHADCWPVVAAAVRERDAYMRAKSENDDRFQIEAGEQRQRADKAERAFAAVRELCAMAEAKLRTEAALRGAAKAMAVAAGAFVALHRGDHALGPVGIRLRKAVDGFVGAQEALAGTEAGPMTPEERVARIRGVLSRTRECFGGASFSDVEKVVLDEMRAAVQDAEMVAEDLRSALVCQCRDNPAMRKGELCWCAPEYDAAAYGHSIACAAAKDALAAFPPDCGLRLRRLEAVAAATEKANRECGACGRVGFVPREEGVGPCPECADLVDAVIALAKPEGK